MTLSSLRRATVGLAGGLLLWPAAAHAATVSAPAFHDPRTTFTVSGTAVIVSSTNPTVLKRFAGHTVAVVCEAGVATLDASDDAAPQLPLDVSIVADKATWAAGSQSATVVLPEDVSDRVDVCGLGDVNDPSADNLPVAAFTAAGRSEIESDQQGSQGPPETAAAKAAKHQLRVAYRAAKAAARVNGGRFGNARAVAAAIRARHPKLRVRVARTPAGAKRRGVVYVIAGATGGQQRIMLVERDRRGGLHILSLTPPTPLVF
jgi:hypothetical protein